MSVRIKLFFVLTVLGLAALAVAWRERQSAHTDRIALTLMTEKRASLEQQIRREEERAASLDRERDGLQAVLHGLHSLPKKTSPAYKPVQVIEPAEAAMMRMMATGPWQDIALQKNPKLQVQYLASERTNLGLRYGPLLQTLGLTPEQSDKFNDLMAEHAGKMLDLRLIARTQGWGESDPAGAILQQQADDQLRMAQAELLGESGYRQLQQYERTLPVRSQVNTLAGALALTDAPLSARQAERMTQIMANASNGYRQGAKADVPMPGNGEALTASMLAHRTIEETIDWETVLTQSRGILSDAQFALFEAYVTKDQAVLHLFNLIQESPGDPMVGFTFGRR